MPASTAIKPVHKKIDKLNQLAWDIRVNDSLKAFTITERALELARPAHYKKGIAEATRTMGFCYVRLSKNDEALPLLNESLLLFKELGDLNGQAVVNEYLGVIKRNRGDLGAALEYFFNAVALSQHTGRTENEAIHHYQIGVTYKYLGNFDKALESLFKSISIHKENRNRFYQSYPINVIGSIYFETGEYKKALEYFKEGLKLRQEFKDKLGEAGSLANIGFTLFKLKKYNQALTFCQKSLEISKSTDDKRTQAGALQHLAEIYAQAGNIEKAIISSNASRKIRKVTGDKRGEAEILLFQAGLPQQDPAKVLQWIEEALQISMETKSPDIQIKAHHSLYIYYKQEGQYKRANKELEKHFRLEKVLQKNSVSQKIANLEIARKAEETRKEAEIVMHKNEELTRLNRELEVQNSLERVRAVAMGMKKRDDMLDVCTKISQELQSLGVKDIRNVQTAIFYEKRGTYMNYEYYARHKKTFITETFYTDHKIAKAFAAKMLKGKGEVSFTYITGEKKVKEWLAYQKKTNVFIDTYLEEAMSLNYYWHSLGPVALGISTYVPLSNSDSELFKRFLNVFELAYTRYLDIEKAYAQAREAQIEAAVERVRAKALAMHRSEEVLGVVQALKKEMADLGLTSGITAATIFLEQPDGSIRLWDLTSFEAVLKNLDIVFNPNETDPELYVMRIWRSKENFVVIEQDRKDFQLTVKWIRQFDKKTASEINHLLRSHKLIHGWHPAARLQHGWLCVDLDAPPSTEFETILPKMAAAFDLAYKRFLDLQKAEAQATEAKVEAALEKVRSQAMGMQKPGDILNVCKVMFKELPGIGFTDVRNTLINFWDDANSLLIDYDFSDFAGGNISKLHYSSHPVFEQFQKKIRSAKDAFAQLTVTKDQLASWKKRRRDSGEYEDPRLNKISALYYYFYSIGVGAIGISTFKPLSPGNLELLKRFRNVFDLAYRRYLDIETAEAQAKEAQIELGLERVRARAMAMHNSEELAELVSTVFNEMTKLGFSLTSCIIWINDHANARNTLWIAGAEMKKPAQPFSIEPFHKDFFKSVVHAWKARDAKWVYILKGTKKKVFENAFLKAIPRLPHPLRKALTAPKQVVFSASFNNFGALEIVETEALDEEKFEILHRFGKVFEQTYTRFLDLKKAEAQAAEARVEASLERVRAAAMSMHKSEQLINVVEAMYKELVSLGFNNIRNAQISIRNLADNKYFVSEYSDFVRLAVKEAPVDTSPLLKNLYDEMERSKDAFYQKEYSGKDYRVWRKWRLDADPKQDPRIFKATSMWFHLYSLGSGYIGISTFGAITAEQTLILKRFRNVFELAYRRYTDVARAEAQAREAQIEVAVERVRAKALAMHRSEDLHGTVVTLKNELMSLEIPDVIAATIYLEQDDGSIRILDLTAAHEETDEKVELAMDRTFRFEDTDPKLWVRRMWDRKENYFVEYADQEDFKRVVKWLYTVDPANAKIAERIIQDKKITQAWLPTVKLQKGVLNIDLLEPPDHEVESILLKMGASFDLAYKRFLDLQKAESQAHEAQVEVALERVRSRTMAMHKSEELAETAVVLFKQMIGLGIAPNRLYIGIIKDDSGDLEFWITDEEGEKVSSRYMVNIHKNISVKKIYEGWVARKKVITIDMQGKELEDWLTYWKKEFHVPFKQGAALKRRIQNIAYFSQGFIAIASPDDQPGTTINLLERFAAVFNLTYTRFTDLEQAEAQAREAQIELGLERVRARAMAMQKSSELSELVDTVFKELTKLDFALTWCIINIIDENSMSNTVWAANPDINKAPESYHMLFKDYPFHHVMMKGWKERKSKDVYVLEGQEKKIYDEYLFNETEFRRVPAAAQASSRAMERYVVTFSFSNFGGLQTVGDAPLSDSSIDILSRFGKVFDLTYTRFNDLQKAEAQAREAQIEAALERVRSASMAMHASDELQNVIRVLTDQLSFLGFDFHTANFITNASMPDWEIWISSPGSNIPPKLFVPYFNHRLFNERNDAVASGKEMLTVELNPEEKDSFLNYFFEHSLAKNTDDERIKWVLEQPGMALTTVVTKSFSLSVINYHGKSYTQQENEVIKRLAYVFEQSYTRFLDLQKAEAQTREAQIEAALEKVRSRTMAMQKSDELGDVATVLFKQLNVLVKDLWTCGFVLCEKDRPEDEWWLCTESGFIPAFNLPNVGDVTHYNIYQGWLNGEEYHTEQLEGEALREHYNWLMSIPIAKKIFDGFAAAGFERPKWQKLHCAYFSKGYLCIITQVPCPDENIFRRFAQVFDLTYTRFLDLQNAEAQARESQVQLALERVRARSMAMQHSEELSDTAMVLFEQFRALGENADRIAIGLVNEAEQVFEFWATLHGGSKLQMAFRLPISEPYIMKKMYDAWKKKQRSLTIDLLGDRLERYFQFLKDQGVPVERKIFGKRRVEHIATFSKGVLMMINDVPAADESIAVLERFAAVFDQTYTRFLDLQKAEEQARESQIETALERVRSRTMAMHNSNDLLQVVTVLRDQLRELGFDLHAVNFITDLSQSGYNMWLASPGEEILKMVQMPRVDYRGTYMLEEAVRNKREVISYVLEKHEKDLFFTHFFQTAVMKDTPAEFKQEIFDQPGMAISLFVLQSIVLTVANFKMISLTQEQIETVRRFAKVFEQSYTRFLDLQKAEEQAKESQIQLALERVRARTMAMQRSDELPDCASLLFHQIQNLGMPTWAAGYCTWEENKDTITLWMSSEGVLQPPFKAPTTEDELFIQMRKGYEEGKSLHVVEMGGEELVAHYRYMRTLPVVGEIFDTVEKAGHPLPVFQVMHYAYFSKGFLLIITYEPVPAAHEIFTRFSSVFDQTYTRFLDLQKAEAQARESQIQLALERVRARTMAMHKSEELGEIVGLMYEQFEELDFGFYQVLVSIYDEKNHRIEWWSKGFGEKSLPQCSIIPLIDHPFSNDLLQKWKNKVEYYPHVFEGESKRSWEEYLFTQTDLKYFPEEVKQAMQSIDKVYLSDVFMKYGSLQAGGPAPLPDDKAEILKRFANVLDLAYTRMTDLKKAEAQAREAQIELGLERVRARAMAMQTSEELKGLIGTVFTELTKLDLVLTRCVIMIYNNETRDSKWWMANSEDPDNPNGFYVKVHDHPPMAAYFTGWRERKMRWIYILKGQVKKDWDEFLFKETELKHLPLQVIEGMKAPDLVYLNASFNTFGNLTLASLEPLSEEHFDILLRFAKVFDLTYTRFNDLQKAEAQTREAKIETSLERVRSKAMAMHSSEDLAATIRVFYREMESLIFTPRRCGVGLIDKESRVAELSTMNSTAEGDSVEIIGKLKMSGHPVLEGVYDNWLLQKEYHPVLRGNEIKEYYALIRPQVAFPDYSEDTVQYGYFFYFPEGGVYAWTDKELTEDELNIYRRFTSVLSLTYKRYKDLQKAEGQAREAQIEVALERVRSRAMAMHRTEELNDTVAVVFEELDKLNLGVLRVGISVLNKEKRTGDVWVTSIDKDKAVQVSGDESFDIHPLLHGAFEAWLRQEDFYYELEGDDLTRYYQAVEAAQFKLPDSQMLVSGTDQKQYCFVAVYNSGGLFAFRDSDFPEEAKMVMKRFANVFDLTYKRFLDLQRAEAQAREAHVQLALERVRARTMAMQHSSELPEAAVVLCQQFAALGETPDRISIGIINEDAQTTEVWATNQAGTQIDIHFAARNDEPTTISKIYKEWKAGKRSTIVDLQEKNLHDWITYLRSELGLTVDDSYFQGRRIHQVSFFSQGWLNITTLEPLPQETLDLLDRFAAVFTLTYTRFVDLKKAEAQAREAQIEAALERVRAKVIAMQNSSELQDISYVFGDQIRQLKIDWQFSYFWLIEEDNDVNTFWITWPDNHTSVTSYSLAEADDYTRECLVFWRAGQKMHSNTIPPEGVSHFLETFKQLVHDAGPSAQMVMQESNFPEGVIYYDAMMKYGSFGLCMNRQATEEENKIQCRFAIEFERAYTRFLDLKQAEKMAQQAEEDLVQLKIEKQRTEEALAELQVTQRQLVQSEKMASLGELTAGIAHEIQNPLNFVNNFSEVSNELIDEMVEEVAKGNLEEAKAIAEDVKQNLEKINFHGKRADGIVKGMLQHSRSSSGQKELADINALADEYLRLAYHGLRAKDKTFNAKFETKLDPSLPKISIVPQDIGRVILNLITNAFYVVAEKKKKSQNRYEPAVTVSTKNYSDKVEVKVEDNGSGIPAHVLDKIFQPFFTTKPTGQGTGLGLSLSYDIVKAHGGELKVETAENEGSRFYIYLPIETKAT